MYLLTGRSVLRPRNRYLGCIGPNKFLCDSGRWPVAGGVRLVSNPTTCHMPFININTSTSAICIWGYAPVGVALNTARDIGGRLMVLTIWGTKGAGGNYAALAALTNLIATPLAVLFYELFLTSSSRGKCFLIHRPNCC